MKSKYLNQTYEDWKVVGAVRTSGNHKSFILAKKVKENTLFMTLRDSQLSKVALAKTTIRELVNGKLYQVAKNIRTTENTITVL